MYKLALVAVVVSLILFTLVDYTEPEWMTPAYRKLKKHCIKSYCGRLQNSKSCSLYRNRLKKNYCLFCWAIHCKRQKNTRSVLLLTKLSSSP